MTSSAPYTLTTTWPWPVAWRPKPPSPPNRFRPPPHLEVTSVPYEFAIQQPFVTKNGRSGWMSIASTSPGRTPATSTQPPCGGAVYVVTKNDSPASMDRLRPAMMPPPVETSSFTPALVAIMAPDSTRIGSLGARYRRPTVNAGL